MFRTFSYHRYQEHLQFGATNALTMAKSNTTRLAELLKKDVQTIFLVGAGISTSAGIPDFRSPDTGLYHNLQKLNLPYAEAVFDISFFKENPRPFLELARELFPGQFAPTKFHLLMKLMETKNKLKRVYTQNIDTLERVAGISGDLVVEAHGSFAANHCIRCGAEYHYDKYKELVFKEVQPRCEKGKCNGLIKPDIVFFGEGLPQRFFELWEDDSTDMEDTEELFVTITAGTSLTVYPFASLPEDVPSHQHRVLVNMERVGTFAESARKNDMVFIQSTDEFAGDLCELMGWTEELEELVKQAQDKIKTPAETKEERVEDIVKEIEAALEKSEKEEKKDESVDQLTEKVSVLEVEDKKKDPADKH